MLALYKLLGKVWVDTLRWIYTDKKQESTLPPDLIGTAKGIRCTFEVTSEGESVMRREIISNHMKELGPIGDQLALIVSLLTDDNDTAPGRNTRIKRTSKSLQTIIGWVAPIPRKKRRHGR